MRIWWLSFTLILSAALAMLAHLAVANYLYWRYPWFDLPMHYLGGMMLGTLLVSILMHFRPRFYMIGVAGVAVGWEIFEYTLGFPRESNYVFDTSLDLLMDTLGATTIYIIARFSTWRSK